MTSTELQKMADSLHELRNKAKAKGIEFDDKAYALRAIPPIEDESEECRKAGLLSRDFENLTEGFKQASRLLSDLSEELARLEKKGETL